MTQIVKQLKAGTDEHKVVPFRVDDQYVYITVDTTSYNRSDANFWSRFGNNSLTYGYFGAKRTNSTVGSTVTIAELSGVTGLVSNILAPVQGITAGIQKITVTTDTSTYVFESLVDYNKQLIIGNTTHAKAWQADNVSLQHPSLDIKYNMGIPFDGYLKVELYMEKASRTEAYYSYSGLSYSTLGVKS